MNTVEKEQRVGVMNMRLTKIPEAKTKAYFDVSLVTDFGEITITGFKVVEGDRGLFISLPSRPSVKKGEDGQPDSVTYYRAINFESVLKYEAFRDEVTEIALRSVKDRLEKAITK